MKTTKKLVSFLQELLASYDPTEPMNFIQMNQTSISTKKEIDALNELGFARINAHRTGFRIAVGGWKYLYENKLVEYDFMPQVAKDKITQ
jgi:hypothetical protein